MFDSTSSTTIGYHLFFEPTGILAEEVSVIIQKLAAEYGGPVFTPHVTLLARIPIQDEASVIEKASRFAQSVSPFNLTLQEFEAEDAYFRALYLTVREQDEMRELHKQACAYFSTDENPAYKAHMSLLYGNYPREIKDATMNSLSMPERRSFLADSIHLYKTEGEASGWYRVKEFKLSK